MAAPKDAVRTPPNDTTTTPLPLRTAAAFKELAASAATLNAASDKLGRLISSMDASLKNLNLGIEAWVDIKTGWEEPQTGDYEHHLIGYAKIDNEWGIALRISTGNDNYSEVGSQKDWLFNNAPRALRVDAIEKLPDLLERLTKKAESTTRKIVSRTDEARQLAEAMKQAASEVAASRKK